MQSTIDFAVAAPIAAPIDATTIDAPADAPADSPADIPAGPALVVSSLHVAGAERDRLHRGGWPLAVHRAPGRIWLALEEDGAPLGLVHELEGRGFGQAFLHLVKVASAGGNDWLLIDDTAEIDDRLMLFVG